MTAHLSQLEIDILKAARGDVVRLPYNAAQADATSRLVRDGLLVRGFDDDQPTADITYQGRAALASPAPKGET